MPENDKANLIYATFPTLADAERVGMLLVDGGRVACVNIIPGMTSIYRWQGQRHRDTEVVMILKTRASLVSLVLAELKARHPYDNPALLAIPVVDGSADFLDWINAQTASPQSARD